MAAVALNKRLTFFCSKSPLLKSFHSKPYYSTAAVHGIKIPLLLFNCSGQFLKIQLSNCGRQKCVPILQRHLFTIVQFHENVLLRRRPGSGGPWGQTVLAVWRIGEAAKRKNKKVSRMYPVRVMPPCTSESA